MGGDAQALISRRTPRSARRRAPSLRIPGKEIVLGRRLKPTVTPATKDVV